MEDDLTRQPPIHVCVTNLLESRHQKKTGIPRVEYEVAKYLAARGARVVAWSNRHRHFRHVDFAAVLEGITRAQSLDLDTICDEPTLPRSAGVATRCLTQAAAALTRHLPASREPGRTIVHAAFRRIAAAWPSLSPPQRRDLARRMGLADDSSRLGRFIDVLVDRRAEATRPDVPRGRVDFPPGATMLLLGIWWGEQPMAEVARLKRQRGLHFVGLIYDLIPIRRPEFFTDAVGRGRFTRFIDGLIDNADALCAISTYVARDVEAYAREQGRTIRPVVPVPLCSEVDPDPNATPQRTAALARHGVEPGRFVVFVSTINPRKNHLWAYRLWRRAVEEMGDAVPTLVFAGQRGWRYEELFAEMSADPLMWNRKLRFIEGPTDGEMAWLYANCAFTIFPSLFEGWGLPIVESLSYGKYCLAADNTSLPEAGQGLAFHADAEDTEAWLAELRRVIVEPGYREAAEARIRTRFVARGWNDVSTELMAVVEGVGRREPDVVDTPRG